MLISLLEVFQEWGVLYGGTWRILRVPDQRLRGRSHPQCHGWPCLTPRKIPLKFHVDIFSRSVSRMGVLHVGTWRMLRVPDWRHGGQGHPQYYG